MENGDYLQLTVAVACVLIKNVLLELQLDTGSSFVKISIQFVAAVNTINMYTHCYAV